MMLNAVLTAGGHDDPAHPFAAARLHRAAVETQEGYEQTLARELDSANRPPPSIYGLENLYRRRRGGFEVLRDFVAALAALPEPHQDEHVLQCEMNVFTYAFLAGAENFDFLLPEEAVPSGSFRRILPTWRKIITALERFERLGEPLPGALKLDKDDYLRLRRVLARKSAWDEREALATLLLSGPSTPRQLCEDMDWNVRKSQRVLHVFAAIGVVGRRTENRYVIAETALPLVALCLRETLGLDLLSGFQGEVL